MSDEGREDLQFDHAEFEEGQPGEASACAVCQGALSGSYWTVNGHPACEACKAGLLAQLTGGSGFARLLKAVGLGIAGGLLGAAAYYGVAKVSGYELSLIAILTGWLTGKGVAIGNGHRGGRLYQVLALVLTWGAIAGSHVPFIDEGLRAEASAAAAEESSGPAPGAAGAGDSGFFDLPTPVRWAIEYPLALIAPFLMVAESPMSLVIWLIGLWAAWGTNRPVRLDVTGPHALAAPSPPEGGAPPPVAPPPPA